MTGAIIPPSFSLQPVRMCGALLDSKGAVVGIHEARGPENVSLSRVQRLPTANDFDAPEPFQDDPSLAAFDYRAAQPIPWGGAKGRNYYGPQRGLYVAAYVCHDDDSIHQITAMLRRDAGRTYACDIHTVVYEPRRTSLFIQNESSRMGGGLATACRLYRRAIDSIASKYLEADTATATFSQALRHADATTDERLNEIVGIAMRSSTRLMLGDGPLSF